MVKESLRVTVSLQKFGYMFALSDLWGIVVELNYSVGNIVTYNVTNKL